MPPALTLLAAADAAADTGPALTDWAAALIAVVSLVVSAASWRTSRRSAQTARESLAVNAGISPFLTSRGGRDYPDVRTDPDGVTFWVTNWGGGGMYVADVRVRIKRRHWIGSGGGTTYGVAGISPRVLDGDGPKDGSNIIEIHAQVQSHHGREFPRGTVIGIELMLRGLRLRVEEIHTLTLDWWASDHEEHGGKFVVMSFRPGPTPKKLPSKQRPL